MTTGDRPVGYRAAERRLATSLEIELQEWGVAVSGVGNLRVVATGDASDPPLLFVHGGGAAAAVWFPLWSRLRGRRLVAFDRPGCGLSGSFDYRHIDLRRHAADVLGTVTGAVDSGPVDVVANSMGGLWSLWCAIDDPGRVRSMVQFGAPALFPGTGIPVALRLLAVPVVGAAVAALEPPTPAQSRRLLGRLGHADDVEAGRLSPEVIDWWVALERLPWSARSFRSLLRAARQVDRASKGAPLAAGDLRRLTVPTLFSWSRDDPFGDPEGARSTIDAMPSAALEVTGHGHLPWLGQPDECAGQVHRFLATLRTRS